jgi:hypothetical protein
VQNDDARVRAVGLARCPFNQESFHVKDGRQAELTNSAFGAVYGAVDGKPQPVCDDAGYAPFGFGYRRCAGEFLTIHAIKEFLCKIWSEKIVFTHLSLDAAEGIPGGPSIILEDNIGFRRS